MKNKNVVQVHRMNSIIEAKRNIFSVDGVDKYKSTTVKILTLSKFNGKQRSSKIDLGTSLRNESVRYNSYFGVLDENPKSVFDRFLQRDITKQ